MTYNYRLAAALMLSVALLVSCGNSKQNKDDSVSSAIGKLSSTLSNIADGASSQSASKSSSNNKNDLTALLEEYGELATQYSALEIGRAHV